MEKAIIILVLFLLVGCSSKDKNNNAVFSDAIINNSTIQINKAEIEQLSHEKVTYLSIKELKDSGSNGWVWKQKIVTDKKDVEEVIQFLKSIDYKDIDQELVYGFGQVVELKEKNGFTFVFSGNRVNVNGKYFGIDIKEDEELNEIYENLSYKEKPLK